MSRRWPGYRRVIGYEPLLLRAMDRCVDGITLGPWCPRKGGYAIVRPRSPVRGKPPRKLTPAQERRVYMVLAEQDRITREARGLEIEYGIELKEYRHQRLMKRVAAANRQINATSDARRRLSQQVEEPPK